MLAFRRIGAAVAVGAIVVIGVAVPSAGADTVTMKYQCGTIAKAMKTPWYYDWTVSVEAPAVVTHGENVTLNISMESLEPPVTQPVAAHTYGGYTDIVMRGANFAIVSSSVMWNPELAAGSHGRIEGGTARFVPANVGNVTFTPDRFIFHGLLYCYPKAGFVPPVAATTHVI